MTFKELIDMTLDRIDEDKAIPDPLTLSIIKSGLNQGYVLLASAIDPQSKTLIYPLESPKVLPRDFQSFVQVDHSTIGRLSEIDYEKAADLLFIRNRSIKNGNITVIYTSFPVPLVADTDVIQIKEGFGHALTAYGAYVFQLHRKKYSAAQLLLQEFQSFAGGGSNEA